jgi:superfamily II DNA helicase RecQ
MQIWSVRINLNNHRIDYTNPMKQHIISELRKEVPTIRLVLATVALGMGLDAPGITPILYHSLGQTFSIFG